MKHFIIPGILTAFFSLNAYATLEDTSGFYLGGDVLATDYTFDTQVQFPEIPQFNESTSLETWDATVLGRLGGYLTWGEDNILFTAIDVFGEPNSAIVREMENHFQDVPLGKADKYFDQQIEARYSLGGELKQGVFVTDNILGFLTAGLVYTQFKYTLASTFLTSSQEAFQSYADDKFFLPGFRLGVGGEIFLFENIGFNLNAAYTWYEDKQIYGYGVANGFTSNSSHLETNALQMGAGINIYFNL